MENERVHDEQLHIGDAFGEVLVACQAGGGASGVAFEAVERSDGFLGVADSAKYFSTDSDSALDLASGRVLDIGAGAGRASVALQERGQDVVALDISEGATAVCRDRGVRTTFTGSVFELAASRPEPFDTFLMLGNNLGLLGGLAQAPVVLEALAATAAPGARIVGETADPYTTTDPLHLNYHDQNRRSGRLPGQLRLRVRHKRTVTPWWDYLLCTPDELDDVIAPTAWTWRACYPDPARLDSGLQHCRSALDASRMVHRRRHRGRRFALCRGHQRCRHRRRGRTLTSSGYVCLARAVRAPGSTYGTAPPQTGGRCPDRFPRSALIVVLEPAPRRNGPRGE